MAPTPERRPAGLVYRPRLLTEAKRTPGCVCFSEGGEGSGGVTFAAAIIDVTLMVAKWWL